MMESAHYSPFTGVLVLTCEAFGGGHLVSRSGEGDWWFKTWAVKGGEDAIQAKWEAMGKGDDPIPCLLFLDQHSLVSDGPLEELAWIIEGIKVGSSFHVACELIRTDQITPEGHASRYKWRARVRNGSRT